VKLADKIRTHGREKYVVPALKKKIPRFSIRAGEVVRDLGIGWSRTPAVCSALKTHQFLEENGLRLVEMSGPKSGQTTTVTYTYEFADAEPATGKKAEDPWIQLRGAMKDILQKYGGGEAYLRQERENFYPQQDGHSEGNK
jgi:hypothetical protein